MTDFLWSLLTAGIGGAAAALGALVVCALLRRARAPGWLLCVLWLAVGLRFAAPGGLVPITLPQPKSESLQQLAAAAETIQEGTPTQAAEQAVHVLDLAGLELTPSAESKTLVIDWVLLLGTVWAAGTIVCLARAGISGFRLRRRVALACKTDDGCYTCPEVTTPFTLGVVHPRIYLPADLQGEARRAVLLHERTHIRRGDCLTKPLYYLVVCLHWWNPLAWLAFAQFEHSMECACDEAAVRGCTTAQRSQYCESLLRYATMQAPGGALAFGAPGAGQRILHALRYRAPGKVMLGICVVVAGLTAALLLARPTLAQEAAPAEAGSSATSAPATETLPAPEEISLPDDATVQGSAAEDSNFDPVGGFILPLSQYRYYSRMMGPYHKGDDIAAEAGEPVLAAAGGTVTVAQYHYSYGNCIVIDHGADEQGQHWYTLYAHLAEILVQEGQTVAQGEQIGTVGSTGNTTSMALHFELRCEDTLLAPTMYLPYTETIPVLAAEQGLLLPALLEDPVISNAIAKRAIGTQAPDTLTYPLPEDSKVTSTYDPDRHEGLDLKQPEGTDVLAAANGMVLFTGWDDTYGWTVVLGHGNNNADQPLLTMYSHLQSKPSVLMGQLVNAGQAIGQVGSTGFATGPHLHFAVLLDGKSLDPQRWLS